MTSSSDYESALRLHVQGRLNEAAELYRHFLAANPDSVEAHFNLGAVLHVQGRIDEAAAHYSKALELQPEYAIAHNNLGNIYHDRGQLDKAIESYRLAARTNPQYAEAWNNLGAGLNDQKNYTQAAECLRKAIEIKPDYAEAYSNLGMAIHELGRIGEAEGVYTHTLHLNPALGAAHSNLSGALWQQRLFGEAETKYRTALRLNPRYAQAYNNLAELMKETGRFREADSVYRQALALNPMYADAHFNHGMLMLLNGNLEDGWREYEWRWKCKPLSQVRFAGPRLEGQDPRQKTILLRAEQGLGDTIQFIRYAKFVKERGARVVLACSGRVRRLMASFAVIDQLYTYDDAPPFDFQIPLLSLPRIFGTTLKTIPNDVPYLWVDKDLVSHWKSELADQAGFRIGLNWHGRTGKGRFRNRDIPVELCAGLARIPNVKLISIQQGVHQELGDSTKQHIWLPNADFDTINGAFMDTAAIIMNLDLVITSDTSIAHLAGALGRPVWVALPFVPDWRWLLDRSDSPWYPTMRLFRQKQPGDWPGVFKEIGAALKELVAQC